MEVLDLPLPDMIDFVDFRVTFTINGQPYIQPADDPMINDTYQKLPMNLPQVSLLLKVAHQRLTLQIRIQTSQLIQ